MSQNIEKLKFHFCRWDCPLQKNKTLNNNRSTLLDEIDEIITKHVDSSFGTCESCGDTIDVDYDDLAICKEVNELIEHKNLDCQESFCEKLCPLHKFVEELEREGLLKGE